MPSGTGLRPVALALGGEGCSQLTFGNAPHVVVLMPDSLPASFPLCRGCEAAPRWLVAWCPCPCCPHASPCC